jgi:hypothetical protein
MANTRLCLGVEVLSGKEHAAPSCATGTLADVLPRTQWPTLLRGDCSFGNEVLLSQAEARDLPCLLKLRQTPGVKTLIKQALRSGAAWRPSGQGWEAMEARLRLSGWSRERRVVVVREVPALAPVGEQGRRRRDHLAGGLPGAEQWPRKIAPWSGRVAVLVTTLDAMAFPAETIARLYQDSGQRIRQACSRIFRALMRRGSCGLPRKR